MLSRFFIVALLGMGCGAFPSMAPEVLARMAGEIHDRGIDPAELVKRQTLSAAETNCGPVPCVIFNAAEQSVTTTGQYAYASPGVSDIRGPCPGLNAAANHGYLPRNGIANIQNTITGLGALYGMSVDLAGFLAAYAIVMDGDLLTLTWSIGGPQPAITLGGLLGTPQGISYSHNKYEGDTSIGRNDAYLNNGDAHSLNVTRFAQVYEIGMANDRYTLDLFRQDVRKNQANSISNNPYYFAPLFSTTLVAPAAYNFVINFMSNHSAEEPNGYLNGEMFKQWFGVTGTYPNFQWIKGQERIPDNWYRRTSAVQYNAPDVILDLVIGWQAYPDTFRFGGNTNGVNTYQGIEIPSFTKGSYNPSMWTDPSVSPAQAQNDFACFFFQTQQQAVPDVLKGGLNDIANAVALVNQYSSGIFSQFTCKPLAGYDDSVFNSYPGRTYSPTGPATNYKP